MDIDADDFTLGINGDVTFKRDVHLRQGNREIRADNLEYQAEGNHFKVDGRIEYNDPIIHVTGGGGSGSTAQGANFSAAEFELRQRAARGQAGEMHLTPEGVIDLQDVHFTTCPKTDEAWQLRADSITLNTRTRVGTGRGARVDFKGVPILYLPWMSFPLGSQRKSGFLFPSLGHSTRSGFQFALPYYWNIAPQLDLTFEPVEYQERGVDLAGEVRYLTEHQRGSVQVNYLPDDNLAGDTRDHFHIQHLAELPRGLRFALDAESVSDSNYFEDFAQGPQGTSVTFLNRIATLSYRDEHWRFAGEVQKYQTIDQQLAPIDVPYARLPRLTAGADFGWGPGQRLHYGFDSELVNFDRDADVNGIRSVTGWRLDAQPSVGLNFDGAGYFLRPGIAWRYTRYDLSDAAPGANTTPSRSLPIASLDAGLLFERGSGSHGQRRLTLEPRLLYLNVPFREQNALPLFDTALPDLNLVELFRTNRYVGADRVSDANQLSVGVTSRLLDAKNGTQFLSATLGQTYYFTPPRVLLPDETAPNGETSDFIAQLQLTAYKDWNADLGLQWNPHESRSERAQATLQYKPGPERVVNASYRFQRGQPESGQPVVPGQPDLIAGSELNQAELSTAWPVAERWNVFARYVHSFPDHKAIERFAGFEYRSCCWRLRLVGRRFVSSRTGEQDTGVYLQLELTGLASVGSAADAFLSSAIRGYSPPDAGPTSKPR